MVSCIFPLFHEMGSGKVIFALQEREVNPHSCRLPVSCCLPVDIILSTVQCTVNFVPLCYFCVGSVLKSGVTSVLVGFGDVVQFNKAG